MTLDPTQFASTPAPGRDCGACALCCKVYEVPVLEKPMGEWCRHCTPGRGCAIHLSRPEHCRAFHCFWMLAPFLGPEWKPDRARFVLTIDPSTQFLFCQLDPRQPQAWKKAPYYAQLKQWAAAGLNNGRLVMVFLNKAVTVVLPDKDVALGVPKEGQRVLLERTPRVGGGFDFNARLGVAA